jgi:hypothetical protein
MHSVNHETSAWRNSMLCLVTWVSRVW